MQRAALDVGSQRHGPEKPSSAKEDNRLNAPSDALATNTNTPQANRLSDSHDDRSWCTDAGTAECSVTSGQTLACTTVSGRARCRRSCGLCGGGAVAAMPPGWVRDRDPAAFALDLGDERCDFDVIDASSSPAIDVAAQLTRATRPVLLRGLIDNDVAWDPARKWAEMLDQPSDAQSPTQQFLASEFATAIMSHRNVYLNIDQKPRDISIRAALIEGYAPPRPFADVDLLRRHCAPDLPKRYGSPRWCSVHTNHLSLFFCFLTIPPTELRRDSLRVSRHQQKQRYCVLPLCTL